MAVNIPKVKFKSILCRTVCAVFLFALVAFIPSDSQTAFAEPAVNSAIVKMEEGFMLETVFRDVKIDASELIFPFSENKEFNKIYKVAFSEPIEISKFRNIAGIEYIEQDFGVTADQIYVSDPAYTQSPTDQEKQWWLAKVRVPEAWEVTRGSDSVTVAVLDTGIDGLHEDLGRGIGAGYASYCQAGGSSGQCQVHIKGSVAAGGNSDDNGHGTIVAGIIAARPNNGHGIAGINWNVRVLPVKVLDRNGSGTSSDVASGIAWAVDNGADIINMSLGGTSISDSSVLTEAVDYAFKNNVLIVAAAGNDSALVGSDLDVDRVFPVCSDGANNQVLGVAATDINDKKASFSNYGRACIDIAAPGTAYFNSRNDQKGILSTYYDPERPTRNNLYVFASGTSMATPIVTGVAALVRSLHPDMTAAALRDRITASVDTIDGQNTDACRGLSCTGRLGLGRLNALAAVSSRTFSESSIVKDSASKLYLLEDGVRKPISEFVFTQRRFNESQIRNVGSTEIETIPVGQAVAPLDGTLIKAQGGPTVYLVERGVLAPLSLLAFRSNNFSFDQIVEVPDIEINRYRKTQNSLPRNGVLFKRGGEPAVYVIHEGRRRLISGYTFRNRGLDFAAVVEVYTEEFERYPADSVTPLLPPQDGTLIKSDGDPTIYVFESGIKRALSAAAFAARGYSFAQVGIISLTELEQYPKGDSIL